MHNLLLKCLLFNNKTKEAKLNMNLIDNISDEYIKKLWLAKKVEKK